jgi:hypothetical protein
LNEQRCTEIGRSTAVARVVAVRKGVATWKLSDIFELGLSPNGGGVISGNKWRIVGRRFSHLMIQLVLFAIVGERLRVGLTAGPRAELMKAVRISESGHDRE